MQDSDDDNMEDDMDPATPATGGDDDVKRHAREQHNALERRRRDNIKDMYASLREVIPEMQNERASRAVILKKSIEAIEDGQATRIQLTNDICILEDRNEQIREQIEKIRRRKEGSEDGKEESNVNEGQDPNRITPQNPPTVNPITKEASVTIPTPCCTMVSS